MALACAGMAAEGRTSIENADTIEVSYPSFVKDMSSLGAKISEKYA